MGHHVTMKYAIFRLYFNFSKKLEFFIRNGGEKKSSKGCININDIKLSYKHLNKKGLVILKACKKYKTYFSVIYNNFSRTALEEYENIESTEIVSKIMKLIEIFEPWLKQRWIDYRNNNYKDFYESTEQFLEKENYYQFCEPIRFIQRRGTKMIEESVSYEMDTKMIVEPTEDETAVEECIGDNSGDMYESCDSFGDADEFETILEMVEKIMHNCDIDGIIEAISFIQQQNDKNRFLSHLTRVLFTILKLSKTQQDILNRLFAIVTRSTKSNVSINASYRSTDTYIKKTVQEIKKKHDKYLEECIAFSLAHDTSPFQQNDYIIIHAKLYMKDDTCKQFLMLLDYCTGKKGYEIKDFIKQSIKDEYWSKCIGITSDGAMCNVSKEVGANELLCKDVKTIKLSSNNTSLTMFTDQMWCYCHRLHLASECLIQRGCIGEQIEKFLHKFGESTMITKFNRYCNMKYKKGGGIGTYSNTRWLSRGKLVKNILQKIEYVNDFLSENGQERIEGTMFACYYYYCGLLEQLDEINVYLQNPEVTLFECILVINGYTKWLSSISESFDIEKFKPSELLQNLPTYDTNTVLTLMKNSVSELVSSLRKRFYICSHSINSKKQFRDIDELSEELRRQRNESETHKLYSLYTIAHEILKFECGKDIWLRPKMDLTESTNDEISKFAMFIQQGNIDYSKVQYTFQTETDKFVRKYNINIPLHLGVFVECAKEQFKREFPNLYDIYVIMKTIQPTSVSVERGFSKLRQQMKPNISKETLVTKSV